MTILQRSIFQGTAHQDVRPGAYTKTATVEGIVKDQAYLYERITGLAVPNAGSASATAHDHSGDGDGALIRVPYGQQTFFSLLRRQPANPVSGGTNYAGWSKLIYHPFYCEPGLSSVQCILWVDRETFAYKDTFRAIALDTSLNEIGSHVFPHGMIDHLTSDSDRVAMVFTVETNPGAINAIMVEAWDGFYDQTVPVDTTTVGELMPEFRRVLAFAISPEIKSPNRDLYTHTVSTVSTTTSVPSTFTSFDDELIADDVGLSSYHLVSIAKDDAMLHELATNSPAGNNATLTLAGHNHRGGTTLADCGATLNRNVGSWFYGTIRTPINGVKAQYGDLDTIGAGVIDNQWTGGVNAITLTSSAGTTTRTVARHLFRAPELTSATYTGSTGDFNAVVIVYVDAGKTNLTVGISIGNESGGSYGTESTQTVSSTGRHVLTFSALDASVLSSGGVIGSIRIRMTNSSSHNGASFLYGSSVFIG